MRFLSTLIACLTIAFSGSACAWTHGKPLPPGTGSTLLARLYPGWPQSNSFFPLAANFVLSNFTGTTDNITSICGLPTTFRGACNGTLTSYPPISLTNIPVGEQCPGGPTTISYPTGSNISGAANMGVNAIEIISGQGPPNVPGPGNANKWPECNGGDYGEALQAQIEGLNIVAGGPPDQSYSSTNGLQDVIGALLVNGTTTSASGTGGAGGTATVTFTPAVTIPVGYEITISGMSPSGYNVAPTAKVTASSPGSVSYKSSATGAQTVAGTISVSLYDSVSSQIVVSKAAGANLIAHFVYDEPTCTSANKVTVDSIAANLNITYFDTIASAANGVGTHPTFTNQFGAWIAYMPNSGAPTKLAANGNIFPCTGSPAVCPTLANGSALPNYTNAFCIYSASSSGNYTFAPNNPMFIRGLQTTAIAMYDDYAQINTLGGVSTTALYDANADGAYPNDREWVQALIITNMSTLKCPANGVGRGSPGGPLVTNSGVDNCKTQNAQAMMNFLEAANDALGSGSGSSTLFNASYNPAVDTHTLNYTTGCSGAIYCPYFGVTSAPGCTPVPSATCSGWMGLEITDADAYVEVVDPAGSGAQVTANISTNPPSPAPAVCPIVTINAVPTQTDNCILSYTVVNPGGHLHGGVDYTSPYIQVVSASSGQAATASVTLDANGGVASVTPTNCTPGPGSSASGCGRNYNGGANCIPFGSTINAVTGLKTATITGTLACAGTGAGVRVVNNPDRVAFTGHGYNSCRYTLTQYLFNQCVVPGQRYRTTAQEITAEAMSSIIAGSQGIFWFQQDGCSGGWSYGGNSGSACLTGLDYSSQGAANNSLKAVQYVNLLITHYAAQINAPVEGQCTTEYGILGGANAGADTFQTTIVGGIAVPFCTGGILTFQSSSKSFPGEALVTRPLGGGAQPYYLFVSPLRCSVQNCYCPHGTETCKPGSFDNRYSSDLTGANHTFNITLAGLAGKTATVVYDSGCDFGATACTEGNTTVLDGSGKFSDIFGDAGDGSNYQIKIYTIQ